MNLHIKLNLNSVRKYPDGTFGAQVITSDADDNYAFYACKVKRTAPFEVELDRSNVHEFIDSRWQTATVNDALAKQLTSSMRRFVSSYAHLFTKDVSEGRDGKLFGMWTDAVVSIADKSGKHKLKVGDKIFESKDTISLLGNSQNVIEYRLIGDSLRILRLNLADDPYLAKRLQKQFDVAKERYERVRNSRPIGGGSWADNQNARKEFGKSRYDHRELQRSRA
ncbi:hypothetical protein [Psychrobacter sp. 1044]|uniref:hypothetical protein n=1 Tax=Psychrobacter sp. 1044 TaxID=2772562 RepID=UPI00191A3E18|nr:hypothetical protein [Psychrobacter sp. 1044]